MKRKAMTQQVVVYELSAAEHEEAIREFINQAQTNDGVYGYVPSSDSHGIDTVNFALSSDGGATISVMYKGQVDKPPEPGPKTAKEAP